MYDVRKFENQKTLKCKECGFKFGLRLLDGSRTIKEKGGCPKCYHEFKRNGLDEKHSMLRNLSIEIFGNDLDLIEATKERNIIKKELIYI